MAENDLPPLPTDIPWKRLCVSSDMLDTEVCDHEFPPRWQSSVVVFGYEPPADQQPFDDQTVSFLKVACTITGHNRGQEIGEGDYPFKYNPITQKVDLQSLTEYGGCYGALLEVSIKPNTPDDDPANYPYFADFQPKKRELYELVTQTGSKLSRSLESTQVTKGQTTASTAEVVDNDTSIDWGTVGGVGGGIAGGVLTGGSPIGVAAGSAVGSALGGLIDGGNSPKTVNQAQQSNLLTTDKSHEKREEYSNTTQLSQMYHQLTSYHVGTNRAVFFMLPRPHIVQVEPTFVDGPRILEGIQEFLLIVVRPKHVTGLCVDAYLETAHLFYDTPPTRTETFEDGWEIPAMSIASYITLNKTFKITDVAEDTWTFDKDNPKGPGGYLVKSVYPSDANVTVTIKDEYTATVSMTVYGKKVPGPLIPVYSYQKIVSFNVVFFLRKIDVEPQNVPTELYILGRGVCCCQPANVTRERPNTAIALLHEDRLRSNAGASPSQRSMKLAQANQLADDIGRQFLSSFKQQDRYPRGAVSFIEAQFIANAVARQISRPDHPDNQLVEEISGLDDAVRRLIAARHPRLRRSQLLAMRLGELQDRFGLTAEQATQARRAALWLEEPPPDAEIRWDPLESWSERPVPNLLGLDLAAALRSLTASRLRYGEIDRRDSAQPADTVLEQTPSPGTPVRGEVNVDLVLSTGLSVHIPDVIGLPLSGALCALRDAGLVAEPRLTFEREADRPPSTILEVTPAAHTAVTPHSEVVLRVAQPPRRQKE